MNKKEQYCRGCREQLGTERMVTDPLYTKGVVDAVMFLKQDDIIGLTTEGEDPTGYILGQVMRALKGHCNPSQVKLMIQENLP